MDLSRPGFLSLKHQNDGSVGSSLSTKDGRKNHQESFDKTKIHLKIFTLEEVAWHDQKDDCWLAIYDYVYDCTKFIEHHPGGHDVLTEYAGRDATLAFIGSGHSQNATRVLEDYLIGELPPHERLFRKPGGVRVVT